MIVYAVRRMVDDIYDCMETVAVYASRQDAEDYVAEHQCDVNVWYDEEPALMYDIAEFEVL